MDLSARIRQLSVRHRSLEHKIELETRHASVDDVHLSELKKQKLRLKDEIAALSDRAAPHA